MNPWEQGSEFHWEDGDPESANDPEQRFLAGVAPLRFSTGRAALLGLSAAIGMRRWWVPSYFCGEVVECLQAAGVTILPYPDLPDQPLGTPDRAEPGDVVLVVNTFGVRVPRSATSLQSRGLVVVEDHTHDPSSGWARSSDADWCVASLRKTLPVPDGALLWSPRGATGPREPGLIERADDRKLTAMLLKRVYLRGQAVDKAKFRELAIAGEQAITSHPGMSVLAAAMWPGFALAERRARKARNLARLSERLAGRFELIAGSHAIVMFDSPQQRERMRAHSIANRIYPAILWPAIEWPDHELQDSARDFAARMLAIHIDARYSLDAIDRVADVLLALD
jgi:hypothetical protein